MKISRRNPPQPYIDSRTTHRNHIEPTKSWSKKAFAEAGYSGHLYTGLSDHPIPVSETLPERSITSIWSSITLINSESLYKRGNSSFFLGRFKILTQNKGLDYLTKF